MGGVRRRPGGMERRVGPRPGVLRRPAGHHHAAARTPVPGLLPAAVARGRSRGGCASSPRPVRPRRHVHGRPQPHPLPLPRPGRRTLPLRSGAAGRRRRPRLLADRGARDEHRPAGRLQPRLEAGPRLPRRGGRGARSTATTPSGARSRSASSRPARPPTPPRRGWTSGSGRTGTPRSPRRSATRTRSSSSWRPVRRWTGTTTGHPSCPESLSLGSPDRRRDGCCP